MKSTSMVFNSNLNNFPSSNDLSTILNKIQLSYNRLSDQFDDDSCFLANTIQRTLLLRIVMKNSFSVCSITRTLRAEVLRSYQSRNRKSKILTEFVYAGFVMNRSGKPSIFKFIIRKSAEQTQIT